jgi:hypothetical protein
MGMMLGMEAELPLFANACGGVLPGGDTGWGCAGKVERLPSI